MKTGKVYIVGAGPGDPGLITVKGLDCLKNAEVVVYDRLVDDRLIRQSSPNAEMIYVGKSAKSHAKEQNEINQILVEKALEGRTVVRLKGGDPFVLGRGGEECETLATNRIPYEVVPGISSATAAPAYAGIPVTHRHVSSSFAVITGHEDPTKETSSINWEKLTTGVNTLVFLMGMGNLSQIAKKLMENGLRPDTPAALIRSGTTPIQETLTGTLGTISNDAAIAGFEPPVVIVIGDVVKLRQHLKWFETRPLFGKRILVTRARTQASTLSKMLEDRGAQPIELPAIEIHPVPDQSYLDRTITDLPSFDWVIFTSINGVEAVWNRTVALGRDARHFGSIKIGAIGPATALALEEHGLYPDFMPTEYTSNGIISGLAERGIEGCKVLLPRADIAPKELTQELIALGAKPTEVIAYHTKPATDSGAQAKEMLRSGLIDIVTFTSSSTVTNLLKSLGNEEGILSKAKIACIGPVTAETAEKAGLKVDVIAAEATIPGLVQAIEEAFSDG